MAPVPGRSMLLRVTRRIHDAAQAAPSQEDYELGTIALRLLGLLDQGREASLDLACYAAFGCAFDRWRTRNLERQSNLAWQLASCIPDYDPAEAQHAAMVKASSLGRQAAQSRPVLEMSTATKSTEQKSVCQVPTPAARADAG